MHIGTASPVWHDRVWPGGKNFSLFINGALFNAIITYTLSYEIVGVSCDLGALVRRALHDGDVGAGHVGAVDIGRDRRLAVVALNAIGCIALRANLRYDIGKRLVYEPYRTAGRTWLWRRGSVSDAICP